MSTRRHTTSQTTSERFSRFDASTDAFQSIDEDVSIVIERKVRGPPSTEPLVRRFDPDVDVIRLARRGNEGATPVFQRPEVLKFHHDRLSPEPKPPTTMRVYSSTARQLHEYDHRHRSGSADRERRSIRMSSSTGFGSRRRRLSRSRSRSRSRSNSPKIWITSSRLRADQPARPIHDRIGGPPVRRFASLSPSTSPSPPPLLGAQRRQRRPIAERLGRRPELQHRPNADERFYRPPGAAAAAADPLATPKAPSYFLHDDRGGSGNRPARGGVGNGAAFFRGGGARGGRRGFGRRGRGGGGGGGIEGKWQHDKFEEVEDEPMD